MLVEYITQYSIISYNVVSWGISRAIDRILQYEKYAQRIIYDKTFNDS